MSRSSGSGSGARSSPAARDHDPREHGPRSHWHEGDAATLRRTARHLQRLERPGRAPRRRAASDGPPRALAKRGVDYRIVEQIEERGRDEKPYVVGSAADLAVLEKAGIRETPTVIITPREDDVSVYLTIYCRKLRPDVQIMSRATEERNVAALHRAGRRHGAIRRQASRSRDSPTSAGPGLPTDAPVESEVALGRAGRRRGAGPAARHAGRRKRPAARAGRGASRRSPDPEPDRVVGARRSGGRHLPGRTDLRRGRASAAITRSR